MNITKFSLIIVLAVLLIGITAVSVKAEEFGGSEINEPIASVSIGSHGITFQPKVSFAQLVLTVSTPNGSVVRKTFESGTTPYFELTGNEGDGSFTYELSIVPRSEQKPRTNEESAGLEVRIAGFSSGPGQPTSQFGYFTANRGSIVTPGGGEIGIAQPLDQVILDDLIVDGSACIGQDCVNGESFGFDTLRLKENNLRIKFDDTSSSASFPNNDWQLTANDSSNGGANKFSIDDISGGRTPFTVEAGAPSHSLYVDDGGRLGLGTSTPVVDVHVKSGNTPTLRLEQDGSSGFTPQTWDVAGNETNFFVRDATNGSKLPFKIKPSAPTNSLYVDAEGDIGLQKTDPNHALYIYRNDASIDPTILIENGQGTDGGSKAQVSVRSSKVMIGSRSNHQLNLSVNNDPKVIIDTNGYLGIDKAPGNPIDTSVAIANGAYLDSNGVWQQGSSKTFKENIASITPGEALETLSALNPVKYTYTKDADQEEYAGFLAEDVPELVASKSRKTLNAMDVVAVLTKVVQEQQKTIEKLNEKINKIEEKK